MIIFGIDPGISGAICVLKDEKITEIYEMPTMIDGKKNKRQVNGAEVTNIFKKEMLFFSPIFLLCSLFCAKLLLCLEEPILNIFYLKVRMKAKTLNFSNQLNSPFTQLMKPIVSQNGDMILGLNIEN